MSGLVDVLKHLLAVMAGAALMRFKDWVQTYRAARGQGAILAGLEEPALFVFPSRLEGAKKDVLPRMAIEDFLAINNMISAFMRVNRPSRGKIRTPERLTDDDKKRNNLILICSSRRNGVTEDALNRIRQCGPRMADLVPYFEAIPGKDELRIWWRGAPYTSPSYTQPGPELTDIAMIVKAKSPWAEERRILIVAGIRGLGTWGAAEFLKKWWKPLIHSKGSDRRRRTSKRGDFAALVRVHYEACDIKSVEFLGLVDLDEARTDN